MSNKKSKSTNHSSNKGNGTNNNTEPNNHQKSSQLAEGEERKVHEEIIDRRIRGGADISKEAITEAYDRALKQWQELPGSVVRPPTDITISIEKRPKSEDTTTTSKQTHNNTDNGEKSS